MECQHQKFSKRATIHCSFVDRTIVSVAQWKRTLNHHSQPFLIVSAKTRASTKQKPYYSFVDSVISNLGSVAMFANLAFSGGSGERDQRDQKLSLHEVEG